MKKVRLGDCVELLDYKRVPLSASQRNKLAKIYPYYGAQGVIDYVDNYIFNGTYILVAEDGNNLKSRIKPLALLVNGKFWVNNHAHILGEKKNFNLKFIHYAINNSDISGFITGSAQPKLNQENLTRIELYLPDYSTQTQIAAILSSLDDKIELNSRIASVLEKMMKEIYHYWFVQFDFPDENGKPYQSNGGKMVFNPQLKRNIPQGWEVKKLGDFLNKKTAKSKTNNIPTIDLSIMPSNKFFLTEWSNGEKFKTQLIQAQAGDLLFGSIRPYLKKAGIMPINGGVGQTVYLYSVNLQCNYNFCFYTLTSEDFFQHTITRSKGTRMPVIDSDELLSFQVPYNEQIVKKYNEIINIKQTMISLSQQTQTLVQCNNIGNRCART